MIASLMMYGTLLSILIATAALAGERALASAGLPRRGAWLAALLLTLALPTTLAWHAHAQRNAPIVTGEPIQLSDSKPATHTSEPLTMTDTSIRTSTTLQWPALPTLDTALPILWLLATSIMAGYYTIGWLRLRRALRSSDKAHVEGHGVLVSDRWGPAVFGFFRPAIVLPRWLLDAPTNTRRLALEHERQHIAARDQLLLLAGLIAVVLAPWNVGLWWQLRRLRFAVEVDCDARVLSRGTEVEAYGAALLSVSQRSTGILVGALALTEPPSDLEKRIRIMLRPGYRRATVAIAASLALCASLIAAAAVVKAPVNQASLRYPPPQLPATMLKEQIELRARDLHPEHFGTDPVQAITQIKAHAEERFPEYFSSPPAQPVLIRMLLKNDLSIETASATPLPAGTTFDAADDPDAPNSGIDPNILSPDDPRMAFRFVDDTPERRQIYMSVVLRVTAQSRSPSIVEAALRRQSPQLLDDAEDSNAFVAVLMNSDGTVQRSQVMTPPASGFWPAKEMERQASEALHLENVGPHTNAYIATSRKEPPYRPGLVYFFPQSDHPGDDVDPTRFGSQDNPVIERTLLDHYFPKVAAGSVQPHRLLWFLIDASGDVVHTGSSSNPPSQLSAELKSTLGIRTALFHFHEAGQLLGRRIVDSKGEPLMVAFAWFDPARQSETEKTDLTVDANVYRNGELVQSGPLSLTFGSMHSSDVPNALRIEMTAREAETDAVTLQMKLRVPVKPATEFAEAWETIAQPVVVVRYDTEAAIEHGVRNSVAGRANGKDAEVWRITLKPHHT